MEQPWLGSYPNGISGDIDLDDFSSIDDMLDLSIARFGNKTAFECMGAKLSYAQLGTYTERFAHWLQNATGHSGATRVAIMLPNLLAYPIAFFGALKAGGIVINCNPLYTGRELAHQLEDSGAETIVILENFIHTLAGIIGTTQIKQVVIVKIGDLLPSVHRYALNFTIRYLLRKVPAWQLPKAVSATFFHEVIADNCAAKEAAENFHAPNIRRDQLALLQYTGGTTGICKGAMLTHGNLLANLAQAYAWVKNDLAEGKETLITALPLYHIFAITANLLLFIRIGGHNVLITNPREIRSLVKELSKHSFTILTGVNTLFQALLNANKFDKLDFSSLKVTLGGGSSIHPKVAERWHEATGKPIIEAYGLTEASPAVTINPLTLSRFNGSVGLPLPATEVSIRNESGQSLPPLCEGELCVRGPQVMAGYYRREDETALVMTDDGFLKTGDIAVMDEAGFIKIIDRKKDMILVSGFNAYPSEIESVALLHPDIREAAAVGIPDAKTGEAVKLYAIRDNDALTSEALRLHCRRYLTPYKTPKQIEFVSELPKSNLGKVLRRKLKSESTPPNQS